MNNKTILVAGATGQQGGAVARYLLKQPGFAVRALTRDSAKPAARSLAQAGAEVVQGDLDDPASVRRALEGAWGAFSVQNFMETGYDGEIRQGKLLADTIELAGDELTMLQVAETLGRVLGRNVKYIQVPWEQFRQDAGEEMTDMYRWFNYVGYHVDIATLRKEYPNLSTLEKALRQQDWAAAAAATRRAA